MLGGAEGAKELDLLREILEKELPVKFTKGAEKLAALDAFLQFARNPTSMSAGYGIEENYPFIKRNLSERYDLGEISVEAIVFFLKESVRRMEKINYDIDFWRKAVGDYVTREHLTEFMDWYESMYENLDEKKKKRISLSAVRSPQFTQSSRNKRRSRVVCVLLR